ncbi:MAG: hypothetical protein AAFX85_00365 [Pseudomonadota bacterium]
MRNERLLAWLASATLALALGACSSSSPTGGGANDVGGEQGGDTGGGDTGGDTGGMDTGTDTGVSITVNGVVTDAPIANAVVTLTVNGQSFEAPVPTDAEGRYSVDITSDDPEALVLCEAVDPNGAARFTALLDNFEGFQESADENGEVQDVDITNVTTAQFVLAQQLAEDGQIDDLEELESVSEMVDTEDLLELSAAIKVVVEAIDGVVLPDGIDDTQALAEAIVNDETTFIEDLETTNPGTLEDAVDLVLTDGNATTEWTEDFVPGVYQPLDDDQFFVFLAGGIGYEQFSLSDFDNLAPGEQGDFPARDDGIGASCESDDVDDRPEVAFNEVACEGDDCPPPPCEGEDCPPTCEGDDCATPCEGDECLPPCEGDDCAPAPCGEDGQSCDTPVCDDDGNCADVPCADGEDCPPPCDQDAGCAVPPPADECGEGCCPNGDGGDYADYDDYDAVDLTTLAWEINDDGQLNLSAEADDGTVESELVTLLSVASAVISVTVEGDRADGTREAQTARRIGFDSTGFDAASVQGTYVPTTEAGEDVIVFLADGSGYELNLFSGVQDDLFRWTVDGSGVLQLTFDDQERTSVYLLEGSTATLLQLLIIDVDANGEVEELLVETVNYDPQIATGPMPDAANTALLAGKTYAEIADDSLGLFTFGEDGTFEEIFQRLEDDGVYDAGEDEGTWSVDGEGVIRVTFENDEGEDTGAAIVTGGLGGEEMVIETVGSDEETRSLNLIRVEAFTEEELLGSWFELGDDGLAVVSLSFFEDGSGAYEDELGGDQFDWTIDGEGRIRVFPGSTGESIGVETVTFYKLANSTDDMLSVVMVFRLDGELDVDFDVEPGETPRQAIDTLMLFRAF